MFENEKKYKYPSTNDKNKTLETNPHYTDRRFDEEQTIFGRSEKGLLYNYSDRLWEYDWNKAEEASKVANNSGVVSRSATYYEVYLSEYFGKPIEIKHIIAGINRSNGCSYCVFGYKDKK